jgi:hypothetical protein
MKTRQGGSVRWRPNEGVVTVGGWVVAVLGLLAGAILHPRLRTLLLGVAILMLAIGAAVVCLVKPRR